MRFGLKYSHAYFKLIMVIEIVQLSGSSCENMLLIKYKHLPTRTSYTALKLLYVGLYLGYNNAIVLYLFLCVLIHQLLKIIIIVIVVYSLLSNIYIYIYIYIFEFNGLLVVHTIFILNTYPRTRTIIQYKSNRDLHNTN